MLCVPIQAIPLDIAALPGLLGGISLTCARGIYADEFLIALVADLDELAARTPCRDITVQARRRDGETARQRGDPSPHVNRAMYGTCGESGCTCSALHAASAVFPAIGDVGEAAVVAYYEEHGPRLPVEAVEVGDLPNSVEPNLTNLA